MRNENKLMKDIKIITDIKELEVSGDIGVYLEVLGTNYHTGEILGMGVYNEETAVFIPLEVLKQKPSFLKDNKKYTYDIKKMVVALKYQDIEVDNIVFDTMLSAYLLNYNIKDDIAYLANQLGYDIPFYEVISKSKNLEQELVADLCVKKARFIYETYSKFKEELETDGSMDLYEKIEMPLSFVLADMEYTGIRVDKNILLNMGEEIKIKLELLTKDIYNYAGCEFNIMSPKQLGDVLFNKMQIPYKGSTRKLFLLVEIF